MRRDSFRDIERARVGECLLQFAGATTAIHVEYDHGNIFHLHIDGDAKYERLQYRYEEHKEQRRWFALHVRELFEQDGAEAGHRTRSHFLFRRHWGGRSRWGRRRTRLFLHGAIVLGVATERNKYV